jgi:hypothetical protein
VSLFFIIFEVFFTGQPEVIMQVLPHVGLGQVNIVKGTTQQ